MTDTTQPGQAEHSLWDDEAMHAAYKGAFETDPDVHHWALLCWIRDDMAQALAAAQERIAELEAQLAWKEGLIQQLTNVDMAAMDAQIERLTAQLAERSEYEVVPDGEHVAWVDDRGHGYKFKLDGQRLREIPLPYEIFLDEPTADVHLPKGWHICRRVQREDDSNG